ncbi:helix-hairpin-helix domain-containing protein [Salinilacihabitans rarus]|uniref:helix-hairpin-helix domain-containing protein n=1 Tax=Salinilacihabitans rarus TaxID=2961596 RepID=UPI0020C86A46|nr:helix-hairpin-helix domain-containing protein [Salinilacihabitans rarus]
MGPEFTPDDVGKAVESAAGEEIGTIAAVEGDVAHVEARSGVVDSIRATIGWRAASDDAVSIRRDEVAEIGGDAIRLAADAEPGESDGTGGAVEEGDDAAEIGAPEPDLDETGADGTSRTAEPAPVGEPGAVPEPDASGTPDAVGEPTASDDLDRRSDVEREADAGGESAAEVGAGDVRDVDPGALRPADEAGGTAPVGEAAMERRAGRHPAGESRATADDARGGRAERDDRESVLADPFAPQRTAIEGSRLLFEGGVAIQRSAGELALRALGSQVAAQRRGFELAGAAARAPLEANRDAADEVDRGGRPGRRLELVDGVDAMYRERLQEAGIATLDDLAAADPATVAAAAAVTEKRAESWIEQASA